MIHQFIVPEKINFEFKIFSGLPHILENKKNTGTNYFSHTSNTFFINILYINCKFYFCWYLHVHYNAYISITDSSKNKWKEKRGQMSLLNLTSGASFLFLEHSFNFYMPLGNLSTDFKFNFNVHYGPTYLRGDNQTQRFGICKTQLSILRQHTH